MNAIAPTLQLPRLTLRPFVPDDIEPLHQIQSVEEVLRYFPRTTPPPWTSVEKDVLFQIEHWIKYGHGRWVIAQPSNCHLIGWCGLQYLPDTDEIEIGYLLAKPFWGQGLTTEAAIAAQRWAFEHLDLTELVGIIHPENSASIRVAEKLGMTNPLRTVYFGMDCYRYAITREGFGKWNISRGYVK